MALRVAGDGELYREDMRDRFSNWVQREEMSGSGEDSIAISWGFITIRRMAFGFLSWNSFILREALPRFLFGSQESCASENPFHLTRYCNVFFWPVCLEANTLSTSHSSCPSTRSGGVFSEVRSVELRFLIWVEDSRMECIVDFPRGWEIQPVCHGAEYFRNFEGSKVFGP